MNELDEKYERETWMPLMIISWHDTLLSDNGVDRLYIGDDTKRIEWYMKEFEKKYNLKLEYKEGFISLKKIDYVPSY